MMLKDEFDVLRAIPLFAGLPPSRLKLLAFASDRVNYAAGQVIFRQGDPADSAYVILSGEAGVEAETPKGPVRLADAGAQSVVGEVAILSDSPRLATVTARTPLETLRISKKQFHDLLACCPGSMAGIIRVLGERMAKAG